jgi:environmental stress-induced protein Ves
MIRILRAADHKSMPWKNGGGVTTEIAVSPEGAGLDAFDWRVSMARVERDGPFSVFPGVDRTLAVLEGNGIRLTIGGREPVLLGVGSEPLAFPADEPTHGALRGGPILDLNVMARRGVFSAKVQCIEIDSAFDLMPAADRTLVLINHWRVFLHLDDVVEELGARDCVVAKPAGRWLTFNPTDDAELFLIELAKVA